MPRQDRLQQSVFQFFYRTAGDAKRFGHIFHFPRWAILPGIAEQ